MEELPFQRESPPVPPINVMIEEVGSTWIILSWERIAENATNQVIIATPSEGGLPKLVTIDGNQSEANITDLLPGTMYSLQVLSEAGGGQRSFPSVPAIAMTLYPFPPDTPEDIKLVSAGYSWITISWNQSSNIDITKHIIKFSGGGMMKNLTVEEVDQPQANVTGLKSRTEYEFSVILVASDGQMSLPSLSFSANTTMIPVPSKVEVLSIGLTWIVISWDLIAGIESYIVQITADNGSQTNNGGSDGLFNATGLSSNTNYSITVTAVDVNNDFSSPSAPISVTTLMPAPAAPQDVEVLAVGVSWIAIEWVQPLSGEVIERYIITVEGPKGGQTQEVTFLGPDSRANVTGIEYGVYNLTVRAVGSDEQLSGPSDILQTSTIIPVPAPPSGIVHESIGTTWIVVSWESVAEDIVQYIVVISSSDKNDSITIDGSETRTNLTGLTSSTSYQISVFSVRTERSLPSNPLFITTKTPAPDAPVSLKVTDVGSAWVEISWDGGSGILHYEVSTSGPDHTMVTVVPGDQMMVNITGLEYETEYTFSVVSEAEDGQKSPMSDLLIVKTLALEEENKSGAAAVHHMMEFSFILCFIALVL